MDNKITFANLGPAPKTESVYKTIGAASVEITPKLSYETVLDMIQWCIDHIISDAPFLSAPVKKIIKDFAIVKFYTNFDLSFLDGHHELSDIYSEYDVMTSFNVVEEVLPMLDKKQIAFFETTLEDTLASIIQYRTSAMGIVDVLSNNAKETSGNMENALSFLEDPEKAQQVANLLEIAKTFD